MISDVPRLRQRPRRGRTQERRARFTPLDGTLPEGGSRLLEAGWPVHHVQHMLGHASLQQTSTYLNATLQGLHQSMRNLDQSRPACKPVANKPARGQRPVRKQAPATDGNCFIH